MILKTILDHVASTRSDVTWIKGPDANGIYSWDQSLPNQSEISDLILSFIPGQELPPRPTDVAIHKHISGGNMELSYPPMSVDFVTGINTKLHRKSVLIKGECVSEEYYENYDGTTYSGLMVKEDSAYARDSLGFPVSKAVTVTWYLNNGDAHPSTKTWTKYYSNLEKIQEGKIRRGNLVSALQMPTIGLISIAMTGTPNPTPEAILEGRKFMADYSKEMTIYIEDSNKDVLGALSDTLNTLQLLPTHGLIR